MSAEENAAFARRVYDAFNRGAFDEVLQQVDPGVEVVNVAWGTTYRGPDGMRTFMQGWKTMDPNCRVEVVRQLAGEEGVTNECIFHATHVGPINPPSGEVPPTGKTVALPFCEVWRIRNGKLTSLINYGDTMTTLVQLGLAPAPGGGD
mgnify:FL=1